MGEYVMVPRELLDQAAAIARLSGENGVARELARTAEPHQGEPVALPARKSYEESFSVHGQGQIMGWNACLDEIAKLGQLYTHPGLDAWQKGRDGMRAERDAAMGERDTLRAQLAERDAMLRKIEGYHWANVDPEERARTRAELRDMLSASAEPSAPVDRLRTDLDETTAVLRELVQVMYLGSPLPDWSFGESSLMTRLRAALERKP